MKYKISYKNLSGIFFSLFCHFSHFSASQNNFNNLFYSKNQLLKNVYKLFFLSHHIFSVVLQIEKYFFPSIPFLHLTKNSKMDYREFIFMVLLCHSSLELRLLLFLHGNQFAKKRRKKIIEKIRIFTQVSCSTVKCWYNDEKGTRIWILMEGNYIENWKITLEI